MTYLTAHGDSASKILPLTWGVLIISVAVVLIVTFLLIRGLVVSRRPIAEEGGRKLIVDRPAGGLSWLYIGVGLSAIALIATAIWSMVTLAAVAGPSAKPTIHIEVIGHQWWWEVRYLSDHPDKIFTTANEIHIPVGQTVEVKLVSSDVIHSFWVPQLAGKTDVIPGQTNVTWLETDQPGLYRGQCAEYCGVQHAHMALDVVASTPSDFQAWYADQLQAAAAADAKSKLVAAGAADFLVKCGICHAVRGTAAAGRLGPDLSHLMTRHGIAADTLPNATGYLAAWISDPQGIKPGSSMPRPEISPGQLQAILAFLETLK